MRVLDKVYLSTELFNSSITLGYAYLCHVEERWNGWRLGTKLLFPCLLIGPWIRSHATLSTWACSSRVTMYPPVTLCSNTLFSYIVTIQLNPKSVTRPSLNRKFMCKTTLESKSSESNTTREKSNYSDPSPHFHFSEAICSTAVPALVPAAIDLVT